MSPGRTHFPRINHSVHHRAAPTYVVAMFAVTALIGASCTSPGGGDATVEGSKVLDVFKEAQGTWDWAKGDSTCLGNVHTVTFSPDRTTMTLTHREPLDTVTGKRVSVYQIRGSGSAVVPGFASVIRASLMDETRKTDAGALVVWDLVMVTPNRYHWHRTDWPDDAVTKAILRCDGTRAVEPWVEPGA